MRNLLRLCLLTIPGIVIFPLFFLVNFLASQYPILFYRGVLLALITALIHFGSLYLINRKASLETRIASAALALSFNICFLVIFPVTIDRSISVFLLNQMAIQEQGITRDELEQIFVNEYVIGLDAIDRRISEQMASNNIVQHDTVYQITDQGRSFLSFSYFVGQLFNTDPRFLPQPALTESP